MSLKALTCLGRDRVLAIEEAYGEAGGSKDPPLRALGGAWHTYVEHFDRFTAAMLDPQFARLTHPARSFAVPQTSSDATVVIVGRGPSLTAEIETLKRLRSNVSVWTSLRGGEALAAHGVQPDLVIVQHASDLDAYLTARHLRDRDHDSPLAEAPSVLAEPRTPATLLAAVPPGRLAVVDPAIGWGLWPATLASLAVSAGAATVGLLGIDLGTLEETDPAHVPLVALLTCIAERASGAITVDLGRGASKSHWRRCDLSEVAGTMPSMPVELRHEPWVSQQERCRALAHALDELGEPLRFAAECRMLAVAARDGRPGRATESRLGDQWQALLAWRAEPAMRIAIQEALGARFLPRFWRQEATTLVGPVWRPLLLASEEIVLQAAAASDRLEQVRTGAAA